MENNIRYIENSTRKITRMNEAKTPNGIVPFIQFEPFSNIDFIRHGFSTRLGGVSKGIYSSMNLSFTRDDECDAVIENFNRISDAIETKPQRMVYAMQTHTTNVLRVGKEHCGMGVTRERDFTDIDGLITNEPGVCLVTSYADCVPLFFVDIRNKCIGLSHSGWRGTVGKMAIKTIDMMKREYGSNTDDIIGVIGPSICQDCYEVSEDVAQQFMAAYPNEQTINLLKFNNNNGKYQLNLHQANVYNMLGGGLKKENIYVTDICTCCNPKLLFSHRASNGQRGGLCGFLEII